MFEGLGPSPLSISSGGKPQEHHPQIRLVCVEVNWRVTPCQLSFLRSWRPGKPCKSFLDAIRFDSTVYEPMATLKTSNRLIFYVFRPLCRPADSAVPMFFVATRFFDEGSDPVRPIPQDPHRISAQNDMLASSP